MIKSTVGHVLFHVDPDNMDFYKDLFTFLGWPVMFDQYGVLGLGSHDKGCVSVWFSPAPNEHSNDYDGPGMNHLGLSVEKQSDVDDVVAYLKKLGIPGLFETPRHRPEFAHSPDTTYYQVMFESPDRILFEVVYTGPISK